MRTRTLGRDGLVVSELGLGCMGLTWAYGAADPAESEATVRRALELGVTFFDTAEVYGPWTNEDLLGRVLAGQRDRVVLASKFGMHIEADGRIAGLDSSPANVRRALEGTLRRLRTDHLDLLYQHRVDPNVPIEDTVGAMAALVREGKVRHLGLSEAGPDTLRRAHAVHPIAALQTEYSLWTRDVEAGVLATCRELGVGFVSYSPLGRGFLTGTIASADALAADDRRRDHPRFQAANIARNEALVRPVRELAERLGAQPAQVALAWLLAQGEDIVPIPGTKRRHWLEQNVAATALSLSPADAAWLGTRLPAGAAAGERYPESQMRTLQPMR